MVDDQNMNLLFLTLLDFKNMDEKNIYTDLMREFIRHHDDVYVMKYNEVKINRGVL